METQLLRSDRRITDVMRTDFTTLYENVTVGEALDILRKSNVAEKIVYFYTTDSKNRLTGVVPTRKLLISPFETILKDILIRNVVAIPSMATSLEACEYFVMHRFLAFPVVDKERHILGVVDVSQFTEEVYDMAEKEQSDAVFETLGFRIAQVKDSSPAKAFAIRFPWLTATIASGTACAFLSGAFEETLQRAIVIAFFMPLVLALGESVSIQTMTVSIQSLRAVKPTRSRYLKALGREMLTSLLLGAGCGALVFLIVVAWSGSALSSAVIGGSVGLSAVFACFLGVTIPWILHAAKLDPRIAAGPVTLALTDLLAVFAYLTLARQALG